MQSIQKLPMQSSQKLPMQSIQKLSTLLLLVFVACHAPTEPHQLESRERSNSAPSPTAIPANLEQLVAAYQASSGFNITYDQETCALLRTIAVERVGPPELSVLRIAIVAAGDEDPGRDFMAR